MKKNASSFSEQLASIKGELTISAEKEKNEVFQKINSKVNLVETAKLLIKKQREQPKFTCKDSISGQPLVTYEEEWVARIQIAKNWHYRAVASQVEKCTQCNKFHLYPENVEVNINSRITCPVCKRADGINKISYLNSSSALEAMRQLTVYKGLSTRAYPCLHANGWHVTKKTSHSLYKAILEFEENRLKIKRAAKPKVKLKNISS